jgi:hypothetical protein
MILPGPESITRVEVLILAVEGVIFNLFLFLRFVIHEIRSLQKLWPAENDWRRQSEDDNVAR